MNKRILWIDDDYYSINGLFRPLEKDGFNLDVAISALDGYNKLKNWKHYDLIVIDLIIPISQEEDAPDIVKSWDNQDKYAYVGIGIIEWLLLDIQAKCPVLILSVVPDPITTFHLESLGIAGSIRKSGLLPTDLKNQIYRILHQDDHSS